METLSTLPLPPTMGMRLDSLLNEIDHLNSTQLYGLIVAATVAVCIVLLGTGSSDSEQLSGHHPALKPVSNHSSSSSSKTKTNTNTNKQPRWHIFKYVNFLAMTLFVGSVGWFGLHATQYLDDSNDASNSANNLAPFLVGWSLFLCYFFGFFGVGLIYNDIPPQQGQVQGQVLHQQPHHQQQQQQQQLQLQKEVNSASMATTINLKNTTTKSLHPPAVCTPVCSDPTSFTKPSKNNSNSNSNNHKNLKDLANAEIAQLVLTNQLKDHELEKRLDAFRAVEVRRIAATHKLRSALGNPTANPLETLPSTPSLDYARVHGANCEIVVGYVPLPVGLVGPLTLNNETTYVPMATTEGCLVASTNRGAKAICQGGGAHACILRDGITRAPCVRMATAREAAALKVWTEVPINFDTLKRLFESTTNFGKLKACHATVAGRNVYLRLVCFSGDAMGMNMVSKGSLAVIEFLQLEFPSLKLVALSGNMCTDKKAAATNWLEGRGKSVVVEATIPAHVVSSTLKTTVDALVHTNLHKNLIGSAMAGALGGFNAHASNIVTAIFLATGQDPAQNVESSNCITLMERTDSGDLWISCTMPSIEVGTVGGGTSLEAQSACLQAMGVKGGGVTPGANAQKLATIVAAATLAGELSLLAALAANTLVQAHMTHNRKAVPGAASSSK